MRDGSAVDMSHNIRQFCQEHHVGVPPGAPGDPPAFPPGFHKDTHHDRHSLNPPRAEKMEDTTFNDLFLRVSFTKLLYQVYLHSCSFHTPCLMRASGLAGSHALCAGIAAHATQVALVLRINHTLSWLSSLPSTELDPTFLS